MSNDLFPRCKNPSNHSIISRSKWLVGSSKIKKSGSVIRALARATRFRCPPLSCAMGCARSDILSWVSICLAFIIFSSSPWWLKQASSTVSSALYAGSCSKYPTRIPLRYTTIPSSWLSLPVRIDRRVDLPVPLRAIRPTFCPSAMLKERFANSWRAPKRLLIFCTSRIVFWFAIV